jgi:tetratricopeptide (TPR) repeat protein
LQGRYHWNKQTKEGLAKGKTYFEQAIEKDPSFAQAYAWLATSYELLGYWGFLPLKAAFPQTKAFALKALELDDTNADAHVELAAMTTYYDWDWPAAEKGYKRALSLDPNNAAALDSYGILYLTPMGRLDEAIAALRRAVALDPLSPVTIQDLGWAFVHARQYDRALEQFQKALEIEPNFAEPHRGLGVAYTQKGMYAEAIAEMQKMVDLTGGGPRAISSLGWAYGVSGQREAALKVLHTLQERAKQAPVDPMDFARVYKGLGEKDHTIEWLQKAYEERAGPWQLIWLKVDRTHDFLRSDPRFVELLKKLGFPPD